MALLVSEPWLKVDTLNHESLEGDVKEETHNSKRHTIHKVRRVGYKRLKSSTT